MAHEGIDYARVFQALPVPIALLTPSLAYADANEAYLTMSGRTAEELLGHDVFDVLPEDPADPEASGRRKLRTSLERVAATGRRDTMAVQRYNVEVPDRPGTYAERYFSTVNLPVYGPEGEIVLIMHRVEEVTELIHARGGPDGGNRARVLEAELYARAGELQELNEELRQAHAREREVALTLQAAMLPSPPPHGRHRAAVRYRPAGTLHVCGDWYDVLDLPGDRTAVAVGDVVGHGLEATSVMGQLRSALSTAARVADGPARALDALALYADSVMGAESTTVTSAVIDAATRTITYSSAGHPPPALAYPDGSVRFLDQATDPPLRADPAIGSRLEASVSFDPGCTLVLYTDGLIERRMEDIDAGMRRLADSLSRHRMAEPEPMADALLAELLPSGGNTDDTALVILRL
jgi:serine phosphatase RsbU (regulator of sigma subunit)